MTKKFPYILLIVFLFLLPSCADDVELLGKGENGNREIPIDFEINIGESPATRALEGAKTSFATGDVIHISAEFTLLNNQTEIRYGALSFNKDTKKWTAVADSKLTWPNTAVAGVFTAYHVPTLNESQGSIITNHNKNVSLLQDVTLTSDPLYAKSPEETPVKYGNAVTLRFSHLCTYLTLEDLTPAYNQFIFSTDNIKETEDSQETMPFNNAFYLQLTPENKLQFDFCRSPEGEDAYQITSTTIKNTDSNSGNVSFFLQPGYYSAFTIFYPTGNEATSFLKYIYTPLADENNTPPMLKAGTAYKLNTVTSSGIVIQSPSEEENKPWLPEPVKKVDIDSLLTAIEKNIEYISYGFTILEKTSSGLKLNYNIDFANYKYTRLRNGKLPNVPPVETFDGDYHTFFNLACPVFHENNGIIKNLGLQDMNARDVVLNQNPTDPNHPGESLDFSRQGGLCKHNKGKISNIRMTNISITASVIVENDSDNEEHQDTENIGLITGSNTGTIDNVRLGGTMSLIVNTSPSDKNGSNCTINMGGLVGQNTDSGTINDIASLDEGEGLKKITVTNNCWSEVGAYYVGGLVGYNAGYIGPSGVPSIEIDCSSSQCTKSFIGLLVGEITTSTGKSATIVGANVAGWAKAGKIYIYKDLDSGSYVGGIAGASVHPDGGTGIFVSDCMIVATTLDNSNATKENVINCTGGCFGRIYESFSVSGITLNLGSMSYPNPVEGQNYFVGTFAGLAPALMTWTWDSPNRLAGNSSGVSHAIGATSLY